MNQSFLTLDEVLSRLPYSRTEWYRGMKEGRFPKSYRRRPDKPEARAVCWLEGDIDEIARWIASEGDFVPSFESRENPPTTA